VLILAGTTPLGRRRFPSPLQRCLKGEIISTDSRQIFRELEIGTAKPTREQLREIRHHFIREEYRRALDGGDFGRKGRIRIEEILSVAMCPSRWEVNALLRALLDDSMRAKRDETGYDDLRAELQVRAWRPCMAIAGTRPELGIADESTRSPPDPAGIAVHRQRQERLSELQKEPAEPLPHPFKLYFLYADRQQTYERVNVRVTR